ncbi:MAG TPA: tRNA (guanosine(37)-N1)-methyltransferase TrmD [Nannocystaceae bacterium]|nr:tRNA (guanosine(37)-N1)-methyltransferase TrmD [Nannocystaceae bacterium]
MSGPTFEVFTLFPAAIQAFLGGGLIGKALAQGLVAVHCTDYRDFTHDRHRTVDDTPYGGGAGMVMRIEPVVAALEAVEAARGPMHRILVTPSAPRFDQRAAERLAALPRLGILCGRYEGIDDRVREAHVDECLSLGDFVLNGGEVAALAIIEAVARLCEGVIGNPESAVGESFALAPRGGWLEHPHYTRPPEFRGRRVPEVLLGGNHQEIARWRAEAAWRRTWEIRPDLRDTEHPPRRVALAVDRRPGGISPAVDLSHLRELAGAPVYVLGPRSGGPALLRDLRQLRRQARRDLGGPPHIVAVTEPGVGGIARLPELLDLLEVRDEPGGDPSPLVLLLTVSGDPDPGVDALYAPAEDLFVRGGFELARSPRMIESSQPWSAGEVRDLAAAAFAHLRAGGRGTPGP